MIGANELDDMARDGFPSIRKALGPEGTDVDLRRAETALKLIGQGTRRMSGENTRVLTMLKVAKMGNIPSEQVAELWDQIQGDRAISASGDAAA